MNTFCEEEGRSMRSKALACLTLVLIFFGGYASVRAVPPLMHIPYQKQTNLPAGTFIMRFSLWNVRSGGTAGANRVWSESRTMTFAAAHPTVGTKLGAHGSPLDAVDFQEQLWVQVDYRVHSFVESPDMMNIYNGNAILDESGEAWAELPEWFEALNRDFRYQLTCIGG